MSNPAHASGMLSHNKEPVRTGPKPVSRRMDAMAALQQSAGNVAVSSLLSGRDDAPIPPSLRREMEQRFGHDFSSVRLHDNPRAADLAKGLSAKAFTVGEHIAFSAGQFMPDTRDGKRLVAHELAHVVQQRRGGPPPPLDPAGPLEQAADGAAEQAAGGEGEAPVAVAGASAPGVARDIYDVQDALDKRMAAEKGAGVLIDPKHLPSFNNPEHTALLGKMPTVEQIMTRATQRRMDELKSPQPAKPKPEQKPEQKLEPEPKEKPEPPVAAPAADVKKPDNNDPQPTTTTGLGYQGASGLNRGQTNVTIGGGYSPIAGGGSGSVQIGSGLHDFSDEASIAAQVQANRDPSGNIGVAGYVNPFYSPKRSFLNSNLHFNAGLYAGAIGIEGQRPPSESGAAYGASGVVAGEALLGGSRDQPWLTLGGNVGLTWQDRARIAAAGIGGPNPPQTYLKDATTLSATGSAQFNFDYYKAGGGPDAETSKTPRWVAALEGTYSRVGGAPYTDAMTPAVPGSSTSYAVGVAAQRNWRLGSGHTILSAGGFAGERHEDDTIGKSSYSTRAPYGGAYFGGSFY